MKDDIKFEVFMMVKIHPVVFHSKTQCSPVGGWQVCVLICANHNRGRQYGTVKGKGKAKGKSKDFPVLNYHVMKIYGGAQAELCTF